MQVERPQQPCSASLEVSDPPTNDAPEVIRYSRDVLGLCSLSPFAVDFPPGFPALDPEIEKLMVRQVCITQ